MNATLPASSEPDVPVQALHGQTMGTTWSVRFHTRARMDLHTLHDAVQARLDRVVAEMSTWEPDSDISRFNRAEAGTWFVLPEAFATVLAAALDVAARSEGAFDPTIAPLVATWGFGAHAHARGRPTDAALAQARERVGWKHLLFDPAATRVLQRGGITLDLSAIAKGYGVDVVTALLRQRGIDGALVEVGGELYGYGGKPDGQPWRVLVESSPDEEADSEGLEPRVLRLDGVAVATSGDRWHAYQHDGTRYSHTIDPRTGHPIVSRGSVAVVGRTSTEIDAWATALNVLGPEEGLRLANADGIAAMYIVVDGDKLTARKSVAFELEVRLIEPTPGDE